ncbi:hypothetical protein [Phocaeicola plebeius]|uniref:hypothetical protein n=1 Tax=Phocaeicola plebeius TaxID=310297 RepID=UPI0026ECC0FB|nr:hypothetical protein [Phocaeicola plebeius]
MSKQVLDIQQMQHLEELGVDTSKANFYWHRTKSLNNYNYWDEWKLHYGVLRLARGFTTINCQYVRTFTLQDILDFLPTEIEKENQNYQLEVFRNTKRHFVSYYWLDNLLISLNEVEFIDAAYEMLCWCAENGYVDKKK